MARLANDLGELFPAALVVAGLAVGLTVRRWIVLVIPLAVWLVPILVGVIQSISQGEGYPLGIVLLWPIYLPIPLALTLAAGVVIGRRIRMPKQRFRSG